MRRCQRWCHQSVRANGVLVFHNLARYTQRLQAGCHELGAQNEQQLVLYSIYQTEKHHVIANSKHQCLYSLTAHPSCALMQTHQTISSSAIPPYQRACSFKYLLVETDLCGQARDLLLVLGVDVREDGVFPLIHELNI